MFLLFPIFCVGSAESLPGPCARALELISSTGEIGGLMKPIHGAPLYITYRPASNGITYVLFHGLGENLSSWDPIAAKLEKDGYGVLRMDLYGHGRTLEHFLAGGAQVPETIDYHDQISSIKELIVSMNFNSIRLVGHSYGGAIALSVAADPDVAELVNSVSLFFPYVQRLDNYFLESMSGPVIAFLTQINKFFVPQSVTDTMMDPISVGYMRAQFRPWFVKRIQDGSIPLTPWQESLVDSQVNAAVAVTKGIRSFDAVRYPPSISTVTPIHLYVGGKDKLVPRGQLSNFYHSMKSIGNNIVAKIIPNATHLFPQEQPKLAYEFLIQNP